MYKLNHKSRRDARAKTIFFLVSNVFPSHGGWLPRAQRAGNVSTDDPHDLRLIRKGDSNPHQFLLLPAITRNPQCLCSDGAHQVSSPARAADPHCKPKSYTPKTLLSRLLSLSLLAMKLCSRAPQPCGKEVKRSSGGAGAEPLRHGGPGASGPRWGPGRSPVLLVSPNNCVL